MTFKNLSVFCLLALMTLSSCKKETFDEVIFPDVDFSSQSTPVLADFSSEQSLPKKWAGTILPAYLAAPSGTFSGVGGVSVFYKILSSQNERGRVVILPGRNEPAMKYAEVAYDLNAQGYSAYILSHRGQGESGRMLSNPNIGHVEFFQDYVDDLSTFINQKVKVGGNGKIFILAHSMGGAIAAAYASQNPGKIKGYVLSAPMLKIKTIQVQAMNAACGLVNNGQGNQLALTQNATYDFAIDIDTDDVTHSVNRFKFKKEIFQNHQNWALGGPSNSWVCEGIKISSRLEALAPSIGARMLILRAGADSIVEASAEDRFCAAAPNCQIESDPYSGSRHEILMETDDVRNDAMVKAIKYFNAVGGN